MINILDDKLILEDKKVVKSSGRVNSIDIFRGFTIFAMIFVNDVAGVRNIPDWLKHMPAESDGMTFVDVVFPAFLFIVGMAIPFSLNKRINQGFTTIQTIKHIFLRTLSLLVLGILMVNMGSFNPSETGINKQIWSILVFVSAIIIWNAYPKKSVNEKYLFSAFRLLGIIGLIVLALLYRGGPTGSTHWLQTSWWGILGLIGWAYLAGSLIFLALRKYPLAILGMIFIFSLMYAAEKAGWFNFLYDNFNSLLIGMQVGSHASIVLAGVVLSLILNSVRLQSIKYKLIGMFIFAVILFVTGLIYQPLFGINKNLATPAWCFYSSFYCVLVFILLYVIVDHFKVIKWSIFLKPAGENPLLAYILPSIFYYLIILSGISFYSDLADGLIGILRSLIFTFFILGVTNYLTKLNIRLHL